MTRADHTHLPPALQPTLRRLRRRALDQRPSSGTAGTGGPTPGARPDAAARPHCAGARRWPTAQRAALGARPTRSCSTRRSRALRDFSDAAAPHASSRRWSCRPRPGTTPASSTTPRARARSTVISGAGLRAPVSLDWVGATAGHQDTTVDDYLAFIEPPVDAHRRRPVNLVGDCQGGWLATIYAALHPEQVNTLTLAGAPIDFHAGEPVIADWVEALLAARHGLLRGARRARRRRHAGRSSCSTASSPSSPRTRSPSSSALLARLDDPTHLERYRDFEDWFKHTQDLPGAFYLWIVEHLFRRQRADRAASSRSAASASTSARIDAPLYLLAGATDHITPPAAGLRARRPRVHARRPTSSSARRAAATSACSWAARRCATTGRRSWPQVYERSRDRAQVKPARRRARAARSRPSRLSRRRRSAAGGAAAAARRWPRGTPRRSDQRLALARR